MAQVEVVAELLNNLLRVIVFKHLDLFDVLSVQLDLEDAYWLFDHWQVRVHWEPLSHLSGLVGVLKGGLWVVEVGWVRRSLVSGVEVDAEGVRGLLILVVREIGLVLRHESVWLSVPLRRLAIWSFSVPQVLLK